MSWVIAYLTGLELVILLIVLVLQVRLLKTPRRNALVEERLWSLVDSQAAEIQRLTNRAIAQSLGEYQALQKTEPDGPDSNYKTEEEIAEAWEERLRSNGWSDEDIEVARVGE